jgi:hypothetical protein
MRLLDLDTSVRDNTISWGDWEFNMVPRDYWTTERIIQQKSRLLKQQKPTDTTEIKIDSNQVPSEVFASETLAAVNYKKADLEIIIQNCNSLTEDQKTKLLEVLKRHESLFQGKLGNWKGQPVSIKVVDGAVPHWSRPYPIPSLKKSIDNATLEHYENYQPRKSKAETGLLLALVYPKRMVQYDSSLISEN